MLSIATPSWGGDAKPGALVFLYGHPIAPPYTLAVARDTLFLNGIPVFPELGEPERVLKPVPELYVRQHELDQRGAALHRSLEDSGTALSEITRLLAELYRADTSLVAWVGDETSSEFWVQWKDDAGKPGMKEEILVRPTIRAPTHEEMLESQRLSWQSRLDTGCVFFMTRGMSFSTCAHRAEVLAEAEFARHCDGALLNQSLRRDRILPLEIAQSLCNPTPIPQLETPR
jgi:hypothetical protein